MNPTTTTPTPAPVRDILGGGVTASVTDDLIVYQLDGEDFCAIGRRDRQLDLLGANDLDGLQTLRLVRGLMFAAERLLQMEFAARQQPPAGPLTIDFGNEVSL